MAGDEHLYSVIMEEEGGGEDVGRLGGQGFVVKVEVRYGLGQRVRQSLRYFIICVRHITFRVGPLSQNGLDLLYLLHECFETG